MSTPRRSPPSVSGMRPLTTHTIALDAAGDERATRRLLEQARDDYRRAASELEESRARLLALYRLVGHRSDDAG